MRYSEEEVRKKVDDLFRYMGFRTPPTYDTADDLDDVLYEIGRLLPELKYLQFKLDEAEVKDGEG